MAAVWGTVFFLPTTARYRKRKAAVYLGEPAGKRKEIADRKRTQPDRFSYSGRTFNFQFSLVRNTTGIQIAIRIGLFYIIFFPASLRVSFLSNKKEEPVLCVDSLLTYTYTCVDIIYRSGLAGGRQLRSYLSACLCCTASLV